MKKRFLFIAVAAAVVIGCTTEMLDTSYEKVLSEAQLKGEHPLVFNTHVGNGMKQTRSLLEGSNYVAGVGDANGAFFKYYEGSSLSGVLECANRGFGIFAYYTGSASLKEGFDAYGQSTYLSSSYAPSKSIYYYNYVNSSNSSDWEYTASQRYYYNSSQNKVFTPNFIYNSIIVSSANCIYDYNPTTGHYFDYGVSGYNQKTLYWPLNTKSDNISSSNNSNPKLSFFAYYPHVNTYHPDYLSSKNPLRIISEGQSGAPILDYKVATYSDDLVAYDLMAAVPVIDKQFNGSDDVINLAFCHLLAAVYVDFQVVNADSYSASEMESTTFYFNRLSLQGADDGDPAVVSKETMFKKRGLFNLATGQWFTDDFEGLDLLTNSWLTKAYCWSKTKGKAVPGFRPYQKSGYYSLFGSDVFIPADENDDSNPYMSSSFTPTSSENLSESDSKTKGYMLIIPNSNQKKLKLAVNYTYKNGDYVEDVEEVKDIDVQIQPGHVYRITLYIELKKLEIRPTVEDWTWGAHPTPAP